MGEKISNTVFKNTDNIYIKHQTCLLTMGNIMKSIALTSTFLASLLIVTSAPVVFAVEEEDIAPAALLIVEEASAIVGLDLEGIEEELVEEIEEAIREEIIEEETVETILDETVEEPSDVLEEREEENREQWQEERDSWLEAEISVREQLNCEPGDNECFKKIGLTVRLMVAEKLYMRVQERLASIEEIPVEERDEELNELYASLQKLETRFASRIETMESRLDGSAGESLKNIKALRENVNNRFMEEGLQPERLNKGEGRGNRERPTDGETMEENEPIMVDGQVQESGEPSRQGEKPEKPAKPEAPSTQGEKPEKPAKPENSRGAGGENKPNDKERGQSGN